MPGKDNTKQFVLYAMFGAIGTAGHFLTLILLVEYAHLVAMWATTAGFVVGAGINYFLNYYYTFSSDKTHGEALFKFLAVATSGAGINILIMYAGVNVLAFHYLLAQITASTIVLLWTFSVNKKWTFNRETRPLKNPT
ncbi:hypothetical protein MNBD_GAMMA25-41 [hydrothermal vent metagenome]|uniref:GtrA/DPMS transmembrane domain-containing protein n=1 Tax=hydrothermal vent metagenome TaxID=652676 RepID=A0A3B1C045_9ZZZZ